MVMISKLARVMLLDQWKWIFCSMLYFYHYTMNSSLYWISLLSYSNQLIVHGSMNHNNNMPWNINDNTINKIPPQCTARSYFVECCVLVWYIHCTCLFYIMCTYTTNCYFHFCRRIWRWSRQSGTWTKTGRDCGATGRETSLPSSRPRTWRTRLSRSSRSSTGWARNSRWEEHLTAG